MIVREGCEVEDIQNILAGMMGQMLDTNYPIKMIVDREGGYLEPKDFNGIVYSAFSLGDDKSYQYTITRKRLD